MDGLRTAYFLRGDRILPDILRAPLGNLDRAIVMICLQLGSEYGSAKWPKYSAIRDGCLWSVELAMGNPRQIPGIAFLAAKYWREIVVFPGVILTIHLWQVQLVLIQRSVHDTIPILIFPRIPSILLPPT